MGAAENLAESSDSAALFETRPAAASIVMTLVKWRDRQAPWFSAQRPWNRAGIEAAGRLPGCEAAAVAPVGWSMASVAMTS
jgi:hypothetical protein